MREAISNKIDQNNKYSDYKAMNEDKYYLFKVYDIIQKLNKSYFFHKSLDVGCADGSFSKKLKSDFNFDAYGLDISEKAIEKAKTSGINAIIHNLEKALPYPDEYFDLVFSCEVIEHIYDTDFFISELRRVLKKDGVLILTTPNLVSLVNRIMILFGKYPRFVPEYNIEGAGHIRAYTVPVLINQLDSHGFRIIIKTSPNITFPMTNKKIPMFFKIIANKLGNFFPNIGSHMIIVAKK